MYLFSSKCKYFFFGFFLAFLLFITEYCYHYNHNNYK